MEHEKACICIHRWWLFTVLFTTLEWARHFLEFRRWFLLGLVWFLVNLDTVVSTSRWASPTVSRNGDEIWKNAPISNGIVGKRAEMMSQIASNSFASCHAFFLHCLWDKMYKVGISKDLHGDKYDFVMFNNWLQFHFPATQQRLYSSDVPFHEKNMLSMLSDIVIVWNSELSCDCALDIFDVSHNLKRLSQVLQVVPRPPELKQFCYTWANALRAACVACHHFDVERRTVRQIGTNELQVMPKTWDLRSHAQLGLIESRWH